MKIQKGFNPSEIIFSATTACNLKCAHCFVHRDAYKLQLENCINFLESCKNYCDSDKNEKSIQIEKIGFSGGEPFLYPEFLSKLIKYAVEMDFMFDRLMTNGCWWKSQEDLQEKLNLIYDAGFDGKIGLSWDAFHNQDFNQLLIFIREVHKIFGNETIEIQSVIKADDSFEEKINKLAEELNCTITKNISKKNGKGIFLLQNDSIYLPIYREPQTFQWDSEEAWNSKKWFKDDYCQGPGNVLFVHADGNIAPCCGFANEEKELFIGNINQSFEEILLNAENNPMVQNCYNVGLGKIRKSKNVKKLLKLNDLKKTDDLCTFCQFLCKKTNR